MHLICLRYVYSLDVTISSLLQIRITVLASKRFSDRIEQNCFPFCPTFYPITVGLCVSDDAKRTIPLRKKGRLLCDFFQRRICNMVLVPLVFPNHSFPKLLYHLFQMMISALRKSSTLLARCSSVCFVCFFYVLAFHFLSYRNYTSSV